jgi:hypothetical protein
MAELMKAAVVVMFYIAGAANVVAIGLLIYGMVKGEV